MTPEPVDTFVQEYLYIEEYDFECIPEDKDKKKQEEQEKRGIVVIEIL